MASNTSIAKSDKLKKRAEIITALAHFERYSTIAKQHNITVNTVLNYLKTHKDKVYAARRRFVNDLAGVKLAHKKFRILELVKLLETCEDIYRPPQQPRKTITKAKDGKTTQTDAKGYNKTINTRLSAVKQAGSIINQIRVEMEGHNINISGQIQHHQVSDNDLLTKLIGAIAGQNTAQGPAE